MSIITSAVDLLKDAIREHQPTHVFALFSGGHDSRSAVEIACRVKEFSGCVHCNTGIGVEETRQYVRDTCQTKGWQLLEYKATENTQADGTPDPQNYDDFVRAYGFPGPAQHFRMYSRLKERSIRRLMRQFRTNPKDRIVLVTGVRSAESVRRMGTVNPLKRVGRQVWSAPIHNWQTADKDWLFRNQDVNRNPVVDMLGMSAECLCGAFAKPGELDRIATEFPYIGTRLDALHQETQKQFPWTWGNRPPKTEPNMLFPFMPMCWNCNKNAVSSKP